jgi:hypothetical protein
MNLFHCPLPKALKVLQNFTAEAQRTQRKEGKREFYVPYRPILGAIYGNPCPELR